MAGQAELEPATECGAVDRRDKRLLGGLDPPEQAMDVHEGIEEAADARLFGFARRARQHRFEPIEIGAGDEGGLAAGDDDTFGLGVGQRLIDRGGEFRHRSIVHHIHRTPGHVPGDDRDAVLTSGQGQVHHRRPLTPVR